MLAMGAAATLSGCGSGDEQTITTVFVADGDAGSTAGVEGGQILEVLLHPPGQSYYDHPRGTEPVLHFIGEDFTPPGFTQDYRFLAENGGTVTITIQPVASPVNTIPDPFEMTVVVH